MSNCFGEHVELPESSISRRRPSKVSDQRPKLQHTLQAEDCQGVLCVAVSKRFIFSGSQNSLIHVWQRGDYQPRTSLSGHQAAVGVLKMVEERGWLISGAGDGTVRIWCLETLKLLLVIEPRLPGNIFSLLYSETTSTLYIGCQSTSVQWIYLPESVLSSTPSSPVAVNAISLASSSIAQPSPSRQFSPKSSTKPTSRFFDSCSPSPVPSIRGDGPEEKAVRVLAIREECTMTAHWGYVYCLAWIQDGGGQGKNWLVSGSGAGDVKIWEIVPHCQPRLVTVFEGSFEAVLSLCASDTTLYAGTQDGGIKVFDLETRSQIRFLVGHESAILSLARDGSDLYSTSADGRVLRWNSSFDCIASLQAHRGPILSCIVVDGAHDAELFTGGDDALHVWSIKREAKPVTDESATTDDMDVHGDVFLYTLSKLISYQSVPNDPHREDCRQAAMFLKRTFNQLGAASTLIPGAPGKNPLVLATFKGKEPAEGQRAKKRVLFYGHYDVVGADRRKWSSDPWTMSARNGYLYGRGVADNKGPILAIATAASALLESRSLDVDLVMLIEGEEEAGSNGFRDAVREHKDSIGHIDCILVSNSYWIEETRPCLTYGLRGVVHVSLEVSSNKPDLHSGVEGGGAAEPMIDLINLISTITTPRDHRISIPSFYDRVRPLSETDHVVYDRLSKLTGRSAANLSARFSEPSFSVGSISAGSIGSSTIIPSRVKAGVSFRLVPDQDLDVIVTNIVAFLQEQFEDLQSQNKLSISIPRTANWWLGDLTSPEYLLMERCVGEVWNVPQEDVLRIREGGSIPSIPFLEEIFAAPAIHLPLGQSSDNGHLEDERLRLLNLLHGRRVFSRFLEELGK